MLAGTSERNFQRLQRVQNAAARAVVRRPLGASSREILKELHWLPISHRVDYKIALMSFKILTTSQPSYLASTLKSLKPVRALRSSAGLLLEVPFCKTATAARAFSIYAAQLWNRLPQPLRNCVAGSEDTASSSVSIFKSLLKTYLFRLAFSDGVM